MIYFTITVGVQVMFEVYCTNAAAFHGNCAYAVIVLNVGGGWDSSTKAFKAPVAGIYYFSFSMGSPAFKYTWLYMIVRENGWISIIKVDDR